MGEGLGVGVIGLGFMGRTHLSAYATAARAGQPNRVVAVSDSNPGVADDQSLLADLQDVVMYEDAEALIADSRVDVVSICTPTDSHVSLACAALEAGKHPLVEKPLALTVAEVEILAQSAAQAGEDGLVCMPAMCMRYWPGWDWLAEEVRTGGLKNPVSVSFSRRSARPTWGGGFYDDSSRCGGVLFDLHVHDADFILHVFGPPATVEVGGTDDHTTTTYRWESGLQVSAEALWSPDPDYSFFMGYAAEFEGCSVDWSFDRDPRLLVQRGGKAQDVPLSPGDGYEGEVAAFLKAVGDGSTPPTTVHEAVALTAMLEAEARSFQTGEPITL